jgi:hypothetical protein
VSRLRRSCRSREMFNGVRLKFTGLSGGAPDCPVSQRSTAQTVGRAIRARRVGAPTVGRGHRTVSGVPTAANLQWSDAPEKEGKISLPKLPPTAPSCLGAIKGTPRRMEELFKHSLIIPKHPDSTPMHLILCASNLSSS